MDYLPSYISLQYAEDLIGTIQKELGLDSDEISKARGLIDKNLPPLVRPEVLSFLFGVSNRLIYSMSSSSEQYYRVYKVSKRGGGTRQIEAPRRYLKLIQRWIHFYILRTHELPSTVTGFVRGKNIFSNAEPHLPSKNLMVLDIKNFFPSVEWKEVVKIFKSFGFPIKASRLLAGLCTFESRLPQGAPTSPTLANLAFLPIDRALQDLAEEWDCIYTRYADDIAFSGDLPFHRKDMREVSKIVRQWGFHINHKKSRIIGSGGRQILAGLVVNTSGLPPHYKRRRWRAIYHQASLEPTKYLGQSSKLKGIAAFVNEYNNELATNYFNIADRIAELE